MSKATVIASVLLVSAGLAIAGPDTQESASPPSLDAPSKLMVDGEPINVDVGHAAPYVIDWNNDGKMDLLVGQFGGGKLRIFLNEGTTTAPMFKTYAYFKADGEDATVPSG